MKKNLFIFFIPFFLYAYPSISQNKKNSKPEVYDAKIKKSQIHTIFEISQILPEVTKKCGFWSYKFIFVEDGSGITYTGNATMLDEFIRNALQRRVVGTVFYIEAKSSNCKKMIGKKYKIIIVE